MPVTEDEFNRYIKRAAQPRVLKPEKDDVPKPADCTEKQTHPHNVEDTSD